MKFTQLFEKSADISEIYQILSKYCQPFKTETVSKTHKKGHNKRLLFQIN